MDGHRRVLCIDDDTAVRRFLSVTLAARGGWQVETVASGEEALVRLRGGALPDLVVTDALMDGMSGYDLCRQIRRDPRLRHLRVVMLTASDGPGGDAAARQAGADARLDKCSRSPFDLADRIARAFNETHEGKASCNPNESFA